jgi:hypothetical protein
MTDQPPQSPVEAMEASVGYIKSVYGGPISPGYITSMKPLTFGFYTPVPQTEEEKAATAVWAAEREAKAARQAARHLVLAASAEPLVAALADLHKPVLRSGGEIECQGCDAEGYEWEYPSWPCRTWELLDKTAP